MDKTEIKLIRCTFEFLRALLPKLGGTRLFTDQTHAYTLATSLIRANLIEQVEQRALTAKLAMFAKALEPSQLGQEPEVVRDRFRRYRELAAKQTTDASRRTDRDKLFVEIIELL